jgi:hypothetical protein
MNEKKPPDATIAPARLTQFRQIECLSGMVAESADGRMLIGVQVPRKSEELKARGFPRGQMSKKCA